MIEFSHVEKQYHGGYRAVRELNFRLNPGSLSFLSGPSGAGKSTLLKLISLNERPSRGSVTIDKQVLNRLKPRQIALHRRKIGMVFQGHNLLFDRSVFDNVALPLMIQGMPHRGIAKRVRSALHKVKLGDYEQAMPITLSGGQQQRVGIARAVVTRPKILLADEPTGNLDNAMSDEIMALFYEFHHHDVTVMIATHDTRYLQDSNSNRLHLKQGKLTLSPSADQSGQQMETGAL